MSKLPRDVGGEQLVRALVRVGYRVVRQTGSHVRLTGGRSGQDHVTVPLHDAIRVGTLGAILEEVCIQLDCEREQLIEKLKL